MKKAAVICVLIFLILSLAVVPAGAAEPDELVILYESDVHCALEGYAALSVLKQEIAAGGVPVGVVSSGDFVQGSSLGAVSEGLYPAELINLVGYDAIAPGNHEFDFSMDAFDRVRAALDAEMVCCNFREITSGTPVMKPFTMVTYGEVDLAYVGVITPSTISSARPSQFYGADGKTQIYTFSAENLYETVQDTVDAAKAAGADYVIALTHLGTEDVNELWSAQALAANTEGLDVILDGHSHSVVEAMKVSDLRGEEVLISSTGTKFAYIGKLTLSGGEFRTELIPVSELQTQDDAVLKKLAEMEAEYAALGERIVAKSEVDLIDTDEAGNRLIRNTPTNLGDFCADAYRIVTGADIGLINGGGIRASVKAGDVTFNDLVSVFPFNNTVVTAEATGQQILDFLELASMSYPEENGTFQHVSGLTYVLDSSVGSSVVLDQNEVFVCVDGPYRVRDVQVLDGKSGKYVSLDLKKTYTIASHNYLLKDHGSGASMFDHVKIASDTGLLETELLETYLTEHLGGKIGAAYAGAQNRIRITDGSQAQTHTVTWGDNLWNLARAYGCGYEDLLKQNSWISNPDVILVG